MPPVSRAFGVILHHNVDKALLYGGRAAPAFGGGSIIDPINIYLAGRAVAKVGNEVISVEEIAVEGSRAWLRANLHALDAERHVLIHPLIRPGSLELQDLFTRSGQKSVALANDTSIGVAHAPLSLLECLVLAIEERINGRDRNREHPAWGEDLKVMGIRRGTTVRLTVACAMIGRHLAHIDDYMAEKASLAELARELAEEHGFPSCEVSVNSADAPQRNAIYLTVTGTSAEAGDDGQVGRGNRANGLITPYRPMALEAVAGKNPVFHVGKIYGVLAREVAQALVTTVPEITAARCVFASQIGSPITEPAVTHVQLATRGGFPVARLEPKVSEIVAEGLARTPKLVDEFIAGKITVF